MEPTESSRVMRGAGEASYEYLFELRTELIIIVGCDGRTPVTESGYFCTFVPDLTGRAIVLTETAYESEL